MQPMCSYIQIEGDYGNALLSAATAVPLVGDTVALARIGVKATKLVKAGKAVKGVKTLNMLVLTEKGYQAIQEIKAGDTVYSRDEETGETGLKRVGKITQRKSHTIYTIEINGSTIIKTTAYHPFYMEDRGWVNAINLVEGDKLSTKEGIGRITYIGKERREEKNQW